MILLMVYQLFMIYRSSSYMFPIKNSWMCQPEFECNWDHDQRTVAQTNHLAMDIAGWDGFGHPWSTSLIWYAEIMRFWPLESQTCLNSEMGEHLLADTGWTCRVQGLTWSTEPQNNTPLLSLSSSLLDECLEALGNNCQTAFYAVGLNRSRPLVFRGCPSLKLKPAVKALQRSVSV